MDGGHEENMTDCIRVPTASQRLSSKHGACKDLHQVLCAAGVCLVFWESEYIYGSLASSQASFPSVGLPCPTLALGLSPYIIYAVSHVCFFFSLRGLHFSEGKQKAVVLGEVEGKTSWGVLYERTTSFRFKSITTYDILVYIKQQFRPGAITQ